jgi:Tfp pilus assembly ATPase PilU
MQTFDGVIENLIREGEITIEAALPYATNQNNLLLRLADLGGKSPTPTAPQPPKKNEGSMLDLIER